MGRVLKVRLSETYHLCGAVDVLLPFILTQCVVFLQAVLCILSDVLLPVYIFILDNVSQ